MCTPPGRDIGFALLCRSTWCFFEDVCEDSTRPKMTRNDWFRLVSGAPVFSFKNRARA